MGQRKSPAEKHGNAWVKSKDSVQLLFQTICNCEHYCYHEQLFGSLLYFHVRNILNLALEVLPASQVSFRSVPFLLFGSVSVELCKYFVHFIKMNEKRKKKMNG